MSRALGYPEEVSIEAFRKPDFPKLARMLKWLVLRFDPNPEIPFDIDGENDRVLLIKAIAELMVRRRRKTDKKIFARSTNVRRT